MPRSIIRAHYEDPRLWAPEHWQDSRPATERARLAIQWLPPQVASILDVGCGNGVLINRLEDIRLVAGVDLSISALKLLQRYPIQGDAVCLPFADNSFDAVVSMELIEHLPVLAFRPALSELVRVARRNVIITVPYRENRGYRQIICPLCGCQFHPYDHVRSFDLPDLQAIFQDWGCITPLRIEGICPEKVPMAAGLWNLIRRYFNRQGRNFPWYAVCPQCGYSTVASPVPPSASRRRDPSRPLKDFINRYWPRKSEPAWWMALYAKY